MPVRCKNQHNMLHGKYVVLSTILSLLVPALVDAKSVFCHYMVRKSHMRQQYAKSSFGAEF